MSVDTPSLNIETSRLSKEDELFLDQSSRIKMVKEHLHFYPQSNDEASRITPLLGHEGRESAVFWHLNEVAIHQYKYGASASGAIESIVREFEEFAGNAVNEIYYTDLFLEQLSKINPNNRAMFSTVFPIEDWQYDNTQIAIFSALNRYLEIEQFANTEGEEDPLSKKRMIDTMPNESRPQRIIGNLGSIRASSLKKTAVSLRENQGHRFSFWVDQLESSKRHAFARSAASIALDELTLATR